MRIRLSSRLVLSVVLIEAIMLSVLVWNSVRLIRSSHAEVLQHHLHEEVKLLARLLAPGIAVNDRAILLDALGLVKKEKQVVYVQVLDVDGKVMAAIGKVPTKISLDVSYESAERDGVFDVEEPIALSGQKLGQLRLGYSINYVRQLISKTRFQNTSIASAELLLSILVTLAVGYLLMRSLRKLEAGAQALARDDLGHRIDVDSHDEIGDLARSFNHLAGHLEQTRAALAGEARSLERQMNYMQHLVDSLDAVIVEADPASCDFLYVSRESENLLGYTRREWLDPGFMQKHIYPDDLKHFMDVKAFHVEEPGGFSVDFRMVHKNGQVVDVRSINTIEYSNEGDLVCRGLMLDVTELKQNEKRIAYLAEHDSLTGLFNRDRFREELNRAVGYAERFEKSAALMFVDLDQFKYINDTLGHQAGDEYLAATAQTLANNLRKVDVLGRLGGDEFGIILPNTSQDEAEMIASSLLSALEQGTHGFETLDQHVTASIGVVMFPDNGNEADNLLAMADAAMYSAKDEGRNKFHTYRDEDSQLRVMQEKLHWEQSIRQALKGDGFVLHFQPILNLDKYAVQHFEVLLRMKGEGDELISPGAFLEVAERFGLIRDVDRWVISEAIRMQGSSCCNGEPVTLAINISGKNIGDPEFLDWIRQCIHDCGADATRLIFEITETAAVENVFKARRFISALHDMGCRIALDDFGVGFSSFHYLKHLSVDMVKLDGSFVRQLEKSSFDKVFVKTMSDMAQGLNIACVAEFVESENIAHILRELGVSMGQGFYLARPSDSFECPEVCLSDIS